MNFKEFRIAARGLVVKGDKLLCVSDDGNIWYTPGGRLEPQESLAFCMEREVFEETGLIVKAGPLMFIHECLDLRDYIHKIHHYFMTTIIEGDISDQWIDEGGAVKYRQFFSLTEIQINSQIFPRFLAQGEWCQNTRSVTQSTIYKGCDYVRGYHIIQPAEFYLNKESTVSIALEEGVIA